MKPLDLELAALSREQDDVLRTIPLVRSNQGLAEALFGRLVDICLESIFLDLRQRYEAGELNGQQYALEIYRLEQQCREVGLDPIRAEEEA